MRTFIAIEPTEALSRRLELELTRLRPLAPQARWVRPDSFHLTLAFLGEVADRGVPELSTLLDQVSSHHRALQLQALGSGTFGAFDRPQVLWVAVMGAHLRSLVALHDELSVELAKRGHPPEFERFEPHLTLARSKDPRGDASLSRCADALRGVKLGEFPVTDLVLLASESDREGMRYRAISKHALLPAPPATVARRD